MTSGNAYVDFFDHLHDLAVAITDDVTSQELARIIIDNVWRGDQWHASDVLRWWFYQDGMSIMKIVDMADLFLATEEV